MCGKTVTLSVLSRKYSRIEKIGITKERRRQMRYIVRAFPNLLFSDCSNRVQVEATGSKSVNVAYIVHHTL
jgi:hypothetical protein